MLCATLFVGPVLAGQPNFLLIVSEDNGPELGCYGDPYARTPNLDQLSAEGVQFNRAFVPQAGCSQSRASFLTGLYPHQHGQIGLATWGFRLYRDDIPNLPRSLKAAGYRTGIIGKLHINPESAFPFDFHEIPGANFARKNLGDYARHAETFITADDEPFFLSVNFPDAHDPWLARSIACRRSRKPATMSERCPTSASIRPQCARWSLTIITASVDLTRSSANCWTCCSAVARQTIPWSSTLEITVRTCYGPSGTSYEGGLRIPMLLRWSGKIRPQVREELVSTIDIMPTLLDVSGASPVQNLPGRDLVPLLADSTIPWRTHLFAEFHTHAAAANFYPQRSVRTDRYKLIENLLPDEVNPGYADTIAKLQSDASNHGSDDSLDLRADIAAATPEVRAAYQRMKKPPRYELYDLDTDPFEFRNLSESASHAEIFADLKRRLAAVAHGYRGPFARRQSSQSSQSRSYRGEEKIAGERTPMGLPRLFLWASTGNHQLAPQVEKEEATISMKYLAITVLMGVCLGTSTVVCEAAIADEPRPNVLMIVVDDMNDWVGCLHGHPDVKTPNIDRLAARGNLFTNAHVAAPVCNPSRVATLTGRRPSSTGIYDNSVVWHEVLDNVATIPRHFRTCSSRWRYIHYADGDEELYDHQSDPNEWNNLAEDPQYSRIKSDHARFLPPANVPAKSKKKQEVSNE